MNNDIIVSVVMITYAHERFIHDAIEGVLMQKVNFEIELIIADDKSPDNVEEIVKSFEKYPNYCWIKYTKHKENKGAIPNFIWALKQAKGKYIAICEGDDFWIDENKLQNQFDFLERNKEYILCSSGIKKVNEKAKLNTSALTNSTYPIYSKGITYSYEDICLANRLPTVTCFFHNVLKKIDLDLIKDSPHGDWPLWVSIGDNNKKYFCSHSILGIYREHAGGIYSQVGEIKRKINTAKTIAINNRVTKNIFSDYYHLLSYFLLLQTNVVTGDEFIATNHNFHFDNTMSVIRPDVSSNEYTKVFNREFINSDKGYKTQIVQLYMECKPRYWVYFFPNLINLFFWRSKVCQVLRKHLQL